MFKCHRVVFKQDKIYKYIEGTGPKVNHYLESYTISVDLVINGYEWSILLRSVVSPVTNLDIVIKACWIRFGLFRDPVFDFMKT